jgi:hypothetical protein
MPIFKIEEREKIMNVSVYEIEAETGEKALDLYVTELAGTLEPVHQYVGDNGDVEDITIQK